MSAPRSQEDKLVVLFAWKDQKFYGRQQFGWDLDSGMNGTLMGGCEGSAE